MTGMTRTGERYSKPGTLKKYTVATMRILGTGVQSGVPFRVAAAHGARWGGL
jgi:hypothetical protein